MHYLRIRVLGAIETDISAAQWVTCRLAKEITFTLRIARRSEDGNPPSNVTWGRSPAEVWGQRPP